MLIIMTDPGLKPLNREVTSFDEVMSLLEQHNSNYCRAVVTNNDGSSLMTARRIVGERTWSMKFYSDLCDAKPEKHDFKSVCTVCTRPAGVHPTLCYDHDPDFGGKSRQ